MKVLLISDMRAKRWRALARQCVVFTKTYTRIVNPSLAELDPQLPPEIARRAPLARACTWRDFELALDDRIKHAAITT